MAEAERIAVIVVGMEGSGASTMAQVIGLSGPPQSATRPISVSKEKPHSWENSAVVELDDIFGAGSLDFRAPDAMGSSESDRMREILESRSDDPSFIICRCRRRRPSLSFWRQALSDAGCRPVFVLMLRHPHDVAASVNALDGTLKTATILAWIDNLLAAERDSRASGRIFVDFDMMLADWRTVLGRINAIVGRPTSLAETTARSIDRFLRLEGGDNHSCRKRLLSADDPKQSVRLFDLLRPAAISGVERFGDLMRPWSNTEEKPIALEPYVGPSSPVKRGIKKAPSDEEGGLTWLLISGAPRSGTSLVRAIVADHPEAVLLQEYGLTEFVKRIQAIVDRDDAAQEDWSGARSSGAEPLRRAAQFYSTRRSREAVTRGGGDLHPRHFEGVAKGIFSTLVPGKQIRLVGDKMPMRGVFEDLEHLASRLDDFRRIIVVRNPLNVVNSSLIRREAARHSLDVWPIESVQQAIREWLLAWRLTRSIQLEWRDRTMIVKYEDICDDIVGQAGRIFTFLDLPAHRSTIPVERLPAEISIVTAAERETVTAILGPLVERWSTTSVEDLLAEFGELPIPYAMGSKIELSSREANQYLKSGFSWREQWGRWTVGPKATIELVHGCLDGELCIELWLAFARVSEENDRCHFVVRIGSGSDMSFAVSDQPARLTLVSRVAASPKPGVLYLDLLVAAPRSHEDDTRQIGIGLAAFRITRVEGDNSQANDARRDFPDGT